MANNSNIKRALRLSAALPALFGATQAFSQTAVQPTSPVASAEKADGRDEIVVTARRREENVQQVPVAITLVSEQSLRANNIVMMQDLTRVAPSLSITTTTRGGSTPVYALRGQRAYNVNILTEPAVTVYFGEVGQSLPTGTNQSFFDLQSVQVLKGPQGTLFGRNTTGGAILITPRAPSHTLEGYAQLGLGDYGLRDIEAVINLPIGDTLALRVGGKATKRKGYMHGLNFDQRANDIDAQSYRVSLLWEPSNSVSSTTIGTYFHNSSVGNSTKALFIDTRGVPSATLGAAAAPVAIARLNAEILRVQAFGKYEYESSLPLYSKDDVYGIQNLTSIKLGASSFFGDVTLKNIVGYRDIHSRYTNDTDGNRLSFSGFPGEISAKLFSEEFQVQGETSNLNYILGGYYSSSTSNDYAAATQFAVVADISPALFPLYSTQEYSAKNKSYAGFVNADLKLDSLADGLSLSAGFRLTRDERGVVYYNRTSRGVTVPSYICNQNRVVTTIENKQACRTPATGMYEASFTRATYNGGINFQANRDLLVYFSYRHGYKSGGFAPNPPTPPVGQALVPIPYKPEGVNSFEIGLKSDFAASGMTGRLNLAAFYDKLHNAQRSIAALTAAGGFTSQIVNAASADVKGIEVDLMVRPMRALTFNVSYAYVDPTYKNFTDSFTVPGGRETVDVSDSVFANIARHTLNASVGLDIIDDSSRGTLSVLGSYYYQSKTNPAEINTAHCGIAGFYNNCLNHLGVNPAYGTFNLRADWRNVAGRGLDLALFVTNVTNKFYYTGGAAATAALGIYSSTVAPPRMFGGSVRVPFGSR
ncbi:TonB-dependent receptor [Sphingobium sp. Sx8-8]|uniref:TonB-dependent receptor n=1 Tax=Sphingobium sp. Sx8-8 TaxID=2933617 RepID=UPI001F57F003|nr:TonB-dependent receptor [Sphingobium sp. Sx8-8]